MTIFLAGLCHSGEENRRSTILSRDDHVRLNFESFHGGILRWRCLHSGVLQTRVALRDGSDRQFYSSLPSMTMAIWRMRQFVHGGRPRSDRRWRQIFVIGSAVVRMCPGTRQQLRCITMKCVDIHRLATSKLCGIIGKTKRLCQW